MTTNREPAHCGCPGPNSLSAAGMCPSCGVEAPLHQQSLYEHLAAGNPQPLIDRARAEAYQQGVEAGRMEVVEAWLAWEVEDRELEL